MQAPPTLSNFLIQTKIFDLVSDFLSLCCSARVGLTSISRTICAPWWTTRTVWLAELERTFNYFRTVRRRQLPAGAHFPDDEDEGDDEGDDEEPRAIAMPSIDV